MRFRTRLCQTLAVAALLAACTAARAEERVTLRNGFSLTCDHREVLDAEHVRLYLSAGSGNYMDVSADAIASAERDAPAPTMSNAVDGRVAPASRTIAGSASAMALNVDELIQQNGAARQINVDLLRSVVNAESGGHVHAVSRTGAQGLMQLMPGTARALGVKDSFAPEQNVRGGTDYLDSLLRRYHDDLPLALAAYNAGPGAVDRYHGVPPYRETRLYVARIIREFNRRTLLAQHAAAALAVGVAPGR
ncbi:lytic transglycosylase domain-containing protein [Terriglobus aquaticus]|uniref:Lytic transglycosylase domain-containing protein n=1 Tax=Terriglobus aquaticus TaxID=940139 RepID=A0ABW9KLA4_9BACT|nr:lytic transglycosylase domain-containing protein [Terriglobus aquaticus]